MFKRVLKITFVLLFCVWLFGTYKFSNSNTAQTAIVATTTASTPKDIVSIASTTPIIIKMPVTSTTTPKKTTQIKKVEPPQQTEPAVTTPPPDFAKINTDARAATVNILCIANKSDLSPISGTGIVISPEGIILTNAHVGQYFLLKNYKYDGFMNCTVRTGSPAYPKYHAELVYLSQEWIDQNKNILKEQNPKGTGEYDYAFLRITDAIDGSPLPSFDYVLPNITERVKKGEPVLLVGYPAGFLGSIAIIGGLNITSSITTIQDYFTFLSGTVDLLSVGGTVVSQKGASGGGVVDGNTTLRGIISISSSGDSTSDRNLYAITLAYINRSLQKEIGMPLLQFLTQDIKVFEKSFQETKVPELLKTLTATFNTN